MTAVDRQAFGNVRRLRSGRFQAISDGTHAALIILGFFTCGLTWLVWVLMLVVGMVQANRGQKRAQAWYEWQLEVFRGLQDWHWTEDTDAPKAIES